VLSSQLSDVRSALAAEEEKFKQYEVENARRKHNYIPLIVALFQALAADNALLPLHAAARTRAEALRKAQAERRKAKATSSTMGEDDDSDSD
jgi:ubiquitin carboxyl-terminal hydrolase L5